MRDIVARLQKSVVCEIASVRGIKLVINAF